MTNNSAWTLLYPDKVLKIKKYFNIDVKGSVFIRIYEVDSAMRFYQRLQISGNDIGFHSIQITSDMMEDEIYKDFPFIKKYQKFDI